MHLMLVLGVGLLRKGKKIYCFFNSDKVGSLSNPVCNALALPARRALPFRYLFIESSALP